VQRALLEGLGEEEGEQIEYSESDSKSSIDEESDMRAALLSFTDEDNRHLPVVSTLVFWLQSYPLTPFIFHHNHHHHHHHLVHLRLITTTVTAGRFSLFLSFPHHHAVAPPDPPPSLSLPPHPPKTN